MNISKQNEKRNSRFTQTYDPLLGIGSLIPRFKYLGINIPITIKSLPSFNAIKKMKIPKELKIMAINELRLKHDFEYWAYQTITILDKKSSLPIKFKLNEPQRKFLLELEEDRVNKKPIRIVLVKGRQWGGSTVTQLYSLWLQNIHHTNWNSVIVGDVESQSRNVRAMYTTAARHYPVEYGTITLSPFEGSSKNKQVIESGSVISIGSMQRPESLRSGDVKIAHISELGLWKATENKTPEDLVQSLVGTIPPLPDTMIVMESTAKGTGNYFHTIYTDSKKEDAGYKPVFVSWFDFGDNRIDLDVPEEEFRKSLSEYEQYLWKIGASLEAINWYRFKLKELKGDMWRMKSEFPSTDVEAFQSTGHRVFPLQDIEKMRAYCETPLMRGKHTSDGVSGIKAMNNITWQENDQGDTKVWALPELGWKDRYEVVVDIGGTTKEADYSVIRVFDRKYLSEGGKLEAILTCKLHLDVDIVAWRAVMIAIEYDNALLVIEKNSLNRKKDAGESYLATLNEIAEHYDNVYKRAGKEEEEADGVEVKYGFHTNRQTKPMIIKQMKAAIRDEEFIERDAEVLDECDIYEEREDGSYGNVVGKNNHDDLVMTTAIGLHISTIMPPPKLAEKTFVRKKRKTMISKF